MNIGKVVIPAQAGINFSAAPEADQGIPACAGMTLSVR